MTELEYVISQFDKAFDRFKGQSIILHGTRDYAEQILLHFDSLYNFKGIITLDEAGESFAGKPVYKKESLSFLHPDLMILTERVKYEEAAYESIADICKNNGIKLLNMYGADEIRLHNEYENTKFKRQQHWKSDLHDYDIVIFEAMDAFLVSEKPGEYDKCSPGGEMKLVYSYLKRNGKKVFFSLRKSYPQDRQIRLLKDTGLFENDKELEESLIIRTGEDLSLRALNEKYPDKKKCYLGYGLVNEFILPACYGIRPFRVVHGGNELYDFDAVLKKMAAESRSGRYYDNSSDSFDIALKKIEEADIVCFDIFDTLITRKALTPDDALELFAHQLLEEYPFITSDFSDLRRSVQAEAANTDIFGIYEIIADRLEISKELAASFARAEIEFEKKITIRRDAVCEVLGNAHLAGRKVFLISDTYYNEEILREMLEEHKICDFDRIYASCDYKKSKYEGLLELIRKEAGEEKKLLMFGNDILADMYCGQNAGYDIFHIQSPLDMALDAGWDKVISIAESSMNRGLFGIVIAEIFNDPFNRPKEDSLKRYAAAACVPVISGYLTWLFSELRDNKYDKVLFSSRDGYILHKIYEKYRSGRGSQDKLPIGIYFYISRHAAFLTCMDSEERMDMPLWVGSFMTGKEVINHFFDIPDSELQFAEDEGIDKKAFLIKNIQTIQNKSRLARASYKAYLQKTGIVPERRYALVDFVAMGTAQDMLEAGMGLRFEGMYFGAPRYEGGNNADIRYYFRENNADFQGNFMEMEYLMTSPDAALISFDSQGTPLFAAERRSKEELEQIRQAHELIERMTVEFLELYYNQESVIEPAFAEAVYIAGGHNRVMKDAFDDWGSFPVNGDQYFPKSLRKGLLGWYPFRKDAKILKAENGKNLNRYSDSGKDYIVINELPEKGTCNLEEELRHYKEHLKPEGIVLAGFHNAQAARYKCGGLDKYVTESFDTHRLYSLNEVIKATENVFLKYRIYCPMPDPAFVQAVYTEDYIPVRGIQDRVFAFDAYSSPLAADENKYYQEAIRRGTFIDECNYYLIELSDELPEEHVIHASLSADRKRTHAFATIIKSDGIVIKKALYPEGVPTLKEISDNLKAMQKAGLKTVQSTLTEEGLIMPFQKERSAMEYIAALNEEGNREGIIYAFEKLYNDICVFQQYSGKTCIDMNFYNAFEKDGRFIYYDQEYVWEESPEYVLWRAMHYTFIHLPETSHIISEKELMERFEISDAKAGEYSSKEKAFLNDQRQMELYKRIYEWKEKSQNIKQDS